MCEDEEEEGNLHVPETAQTVITKVFFVQFAEAEVGDGGKRGARNEPQDERGRHAGQGRTRDGERLQRRLLRESRRRRQRLRQRRGKKLHGSAVRLLQALSPRVRNAGHQRKHSGAKFYYLLEPVLYNRSWILIFQSIGLGRKPQLVLKDRY